MYRCAIVGSVESKKITNVNACRLSCFEEFVDGSEAIINGRRKNLSCSHQLQNIYNWVVVVVGGGGIELEIESCVSEGKKRRD